MNNVGETKIFILNGNSPTQPMRYVWKWWDGSVDVTNTGTVSKQLNTGGNPADGYQLRYTCEAVNEVGQSSTFNGALVVNNPPSLMLGSTSLSKNGADFSFRTRASLVAYDMENGTIGFNWYAGGQPISTTSESVYGTVNGTYSGTIAGQWPGIKSVVDYDVVENGSLTCRVYDMEGGTTAISFLLFGQSPAQRYSAPQVVAYQSTIDSSSEPVVRIGRGVYAEFTVYTEASANPTNFYWAFHGSNGWASTSYSSGTTMPLENGSFRNQVLKATYGETPGVKHAECRIQDTLSGLYADVSIPVQLEANELPEITATQVLPADPAEGTILEFSVTATDSDLDLLTYQWYFPGSGQYKWGRKVYIESDGVGVGNSVNGIVTVTDRLGNSVTENVDSDPLTA